jgi:hypothetical protein
MSRETDLGLNVQKKNLSFDERVDYIISASRSFRRHDHNIGAQFQSALEYVGSSGFIASMPELVGAMAEVDNDLPMRYGKYYCHRLWEFEGFSNDLVTHTEEHIGTDTLGCIYPRGTPVFVVVHGGGILSSPELQEAKFPNTLDSGKRVIIHKKQEFYDLLEGRLTSGERIPIYKLEDIRDTDLELPHQFGVVMRYEVVESIISQKQYLELSSFLNDPLVIARTAGVDLHRLERFYEKATQHGAKLHNSHGDWHDEVNPSVPEGHLMGFSNSGSMKKYIFSDSIESLILNRYFFITGNGGHGKLGAVVSGHAQQEK